MPNMSYPLESKKPTKTCKHGAGLYDQTGNGDWFHAEKCTPGCLPVPCDPSHFDYGSYIVINAALVLRTLRTCLVRRTRSSFGDMFFVLGGLNNGFYTN